MPPTRTTVDQRPGGERADRDQRVHRRGAVAGVQERRAMERRAGPEHDGCRKYQRDPLPAVELERRHHRDRDERRRQQRREHEPRPHRPGRVRCLGDVTRQRGVVAGRLDRRDQVVDRHRGRVERHRRRLGRVVHGRLDAVELVELALDPRGARSARHALDVEPELLLLGGRDGHQADLVPRFLDRGADRGVVQRARPATSTRFVSRSTVTDSTPGTADTSSWTAATQCAQCIPGTRYRMLSPSPVMTSLYP